MKIRKDSVIAVDLSDISKSYANKMPYLAWVWDGSKKEKRRGYWILEIIGANIDGYELTPLYIWDAVFYFLSVELGRNLKLSILLRKIYEKAKRFFQIPPCLLADRVLNNMP